MSVCVCAGVEAVLQGRGGRQGAQRRTGPRRRKCADSLSPSLPPSLPLSLSRSLFPSLPPSLPHPPQEEGDGHAVHVARRRRLGRVDVPVRVHPHHPRVRPRLRDNEKMRADMGDRSDLYGHESHARALERARTHRQRARARKHPQTPTRMHVRTCMHARAHTSKHARGLSHAKAPACARARAHTHTHKGEDADLQDARDRAGPDGVVLCVRARACARSYSCRRACVDSRDFLKTDRVPLLYGDMLVGERSS